MKTNTDFRLQLQFDKDAALYDKSRPHYPAELFNTIVEEGNLEQNAYILEVGCGTGQATRDLGERGFNLTAIEPGANLADIARQNCSDLKNVEVVTAFFEKWEAGKGQYFDAIVSANAWHWVDLDVSYNKAASVLNPNGVLAVFWNFPEIESEDISSSVQEIVDSLAPHSGGLACYRGILKDVESLLEQGRGEFEASGQFSTVKTHCFNKPLQMSAQEFVDWIGTYPNIQNLDSDIKENLNIALIQFIKSTKNQAITMNNEIVLRTASKLNSKSKQVS